MAQPHDTSNDLHATDSPPNSYRGQSKQGPGTPCPARAHTYHGCRLVCHQITGHDGKHWAPGAYGRHYEWDDAESHPVLDKPSKPLWQPSNTCLCQHPHLRVTCTYCDCTNFIPDSFLWTGAAS